MSYCPTFDRLSSASKGSTTPVSFPDFDIDIPGGSTPSPLSIQNSKLFPAGRSTSDASN